MLCSRVSADHGELMNNVMELAREIASKSPVAITGTKHNLLFSRDHSVKEGLDHVVR